MLELMSEAGRSFIRAFFGSLLVLLPGVLVAPNLDAARGLSVAALIASVAAGLKSVQVFVPRLSFASLVGERFGPLVDSFSRAFIGSFLVLAPGILSAPNLSEAKSLAVAAFIAAATAAARAVQGALTPGEFPADNSGFALEDPRAARSHS